MIDLINLCSLVSQDDLLKILGEKHRLFDFLSTLSVKCSYLLFSKEHVKEILLEASAQKSSANEQYVQSCMDILGVKHDVSHIFVLYSAIHLVLTYRFSLFFAMFLLFLFVLKHFQVIFFFCTIISLFMHIKISDLLYCRFFLAHNFLFPFGLEAVVSLFLSVTCAEF